jgi:hypothetical protein
MSYVKKWIVSGLVRLCSLIHNLPIVEDHYYCQLAVWSEALDRRWNAEVWR